MRRIYLVFIVFFAILIGLELNLKTDKKIPFSKISNQNHTSELQKASFLNFDSIDVLSLEQGSQAEQLTWTQLGKIKYENKPHKDYPDGVMYPVVNAELKLK